jgi:sugar phosphate isomerase/epimerase
VPAVDTPFRFALCNEIFQGAPLADVCGILAELGYAGVELAPHTLASHTPAQDATLLDSSERRGLRSHIKNAGLEFVGLHWLLLSPRGLHVTSLDPAIRRRSWDYVARSIQLCADLAESNRKQGAVVVLGSPKQRSTAVGVSAATGLSILIDEFSALAPRAQQCGVTLLMEAIPAAETNLVNTLHEAALLVEQVNSPAVQTMFDVHNAADETEAHATLIARYLPLIRHVHVNEPDGKEPGMGGYDFASLLRALSQGGYTGWVSVEAFDFTRPGVDIARRSLQRLREAALKV